MDILKRSLGVPPWHSEGLGVACEATDTNWYTVRWEFGCDFGNTVVKHRFTNIPKHLLWFGYGSLFQVPLNSLNGRSEILIPFIYHHGLAVGIVWKYATCKLKTHCPLLVILAASKCDLFWMYHQIWYTHTTFKHLRSIITIIIRYLFLIIKSCNPHKLLKDPYFKGCLTSPSWSLINGRLKGVDVHPLRRDHGTLGAVPGTWSVHEPESSWTNYIASRDARISDIFVNINMYIYIYLYLHPPMSPVLGPLKQKS